MYIDLYFFANGLLDGLLLYLTGRITNEKIKGSRMFLGACIGSTAAVLWYYIRAGRNGSILDFIVMLATAAVMDITVWGWSCIQKWCVRLGWLLGLSILLDGLIHLCVQWLQNGIGLLPAFIFAVMLCTAMGIAIPIYYRISGRRDHVGQIRARIGDRWITFYGWLDSGNLLQDPISQQPVIVVEEGVLEGIKLQGAVPIPYRTIDTQGSVLWGIYPEELWLRTQGEEQAVEGVIAAAHHPIRIHGCRAILPAAWQSKGVAKI